MRKTGGGPSPPGNTPAEEALLQVVGERPGMMGIEGIDTDDCETSRRPVGGQNASTSASISTSDTTSTNASTSSSTNKQCIVQHKRKRTTKEEIDIENLRNIQLDSEMIQSEIKLNEMKMKKIKLETEMLKNKTFYYQLKLQSEFSIVLQNDE